jgi:hypothetical protein
MTCPFQLCDGSGNRYILETKLDRSQKPYTHKKTVPCACSHFKYALSSISDVFNEPVHAIPSAASLKEHMRCLTTGNYMCVKGTQGDVDSDLGTTISEDAFAISLAASVLGKSLVCTTPDALVQSVLDGDTHDLYNAAVVLVKYSDRLYEQYTLGAFEPTHRGCVQQFLGVRSGIPGATTIMLWFAEYNPAPDYVKDMCKHYWRS